MLIQLSRKNYRIGELLLCSHARCVTYDGFASCSVLERVLHSVPPLPGDDLLCERTSKLELALKSIPVRFAVPHNQNFWGVRKFWRRSFDDVEGCRLVWLIAQFSFAHPAAHEGVRYRVTLTLLSTQHRNQYQPWDSRETSIAFAHIALHGVSQHLGTAEKSAKPDKAM